MLIRWLKGVTGLLVFLLVAIPAALAKEIPYTLEDRERLIRIETRLDAMEKRFEQRFEQIDKRFEQIEKRFDQLVTLFLGIVGAFAGVVAVTIGFAIWDRRTMIRPFETRMKTLEEEKVDRLLRALRDLAQGDKNVAEALRRHNLL
ncbi:MAG: hypothetical protein ACK4Z6_03115 [Candidatus Methylomirabilales bacterium]